MAGKIFINYRRDDSIAVAGRLHDRLAETFGRDNLFMDVDNIPVGINFEEYLNNQVAQCDAMLSVIGPNWLNAKDETHQRRLDKADDFVAIELAGALARNILVIPVLVDGTRMPMASELPVSLKPFALRNAIQLRNTNFGSDAEQLSAGDGGDVVSPQFFQIGLFDSSIQRSSVNMSIYFMISALTFGSDWKKIASVPIGANKGITPAPMAGLGARWIEFLVRSAHSPRLAALFFLFTMPFVSV